MENLILVHHGSNYQKTGIRSNYDTGPKELYIGCENEIFLQHNFKQKKEVKPVDFVENLMEVTYQSVNVLTHSDMYGIDADQLVLLHGHKYLDRIKTKLGKWRYIYKKKSDSAKKNVKIFTTKAKKAWQQSFRQVSPSEMENHKNQRTESRDHKYLYKIKLSNGTWRYFYSKDEYTNYLDRMRYQETEPDFMKNIPEISDAGATETDNERQANTNPGINTTEKYGLNDYNQNCQYCTATYELRARGYDVSAASCNNGAYGGRYDQLNDWYENPQTKKLGNATAEQIAKAAKETGANARGDITVNWKGGGAHSMVYETNAKGEIIVRDTQHDVTYDLESLAKCTTYVQITRTDNLKLKPEILNVCDNSSDTRKMNASIINYEVQMEKAAKR